MAVELQVDEKRVLPHNLESERAVLAAALVEPRVMAKLEELTPAHFYYLGHRVLFIALRELYEEGKTPDISLVLGRLEEKGELARVGGREYVIALTDHLTSEEYLEQHIGELNEKFLLRSLIDVCQNAVDMAMQPRSKLIDVLEETQRKISRISLWSAPGSFIHVPGKVREIYEEISEIIRLREEGASEEELARGIPSGFTDLDKMTEGFVPSELTILAARPAVGKTSLAINIALKMAKQGRRVGFFSLEMNAKLLILRMLAVMSGVDLRKISRARLDEHRNELTALAKAVRDLGRLQIFIDESSYLPVNLFKAKARKLREEMKVEILIIDYLQLMSAAQGSQRQTRQEEVSDISRSLKHTARELNIPILALAQLSRKVEERAGKRPILSDLRESGSIEQDADVVLFLHPKGDIRLDGIGPEQDVDLIVAKNRNGPTGVIPLRFYPDRTQFEQMTRE